MSATLEVRGERRLSHKERILEALRSGEKRAAELAAITISYRQRISELRQEGYDLRNFDVPGSDNSLYRLFEWRAPEQMSLLEEMHT